MTIRRRKVAELADVCSKLINYDIFLLIQQRWPSPLKRDARTRRMSINSVPNHFQYPQTRGTGMVVRLAINRIVVASLAAEACVHLLKNQRASVTVKLEQTLYTFNLLTYCPITCSQFC